jgi:hypothetical protein
VLVSVAVSAFVLGLDWHVTDREGLVSRVVDACQADRMQNYLMSQACREAHEQARELGMTTVPLPSLEPAPAAAVPPTTAQVPVTPSATTRSAAPPTTRRSTR